MEDRIDTYRNRYRIPSNRWDAWDYGSNAAYFVTICTSQRQHDFGHITDGVMFFTTLGHAAVRFWKEIPVHFPFVELGEYVVMPNHIHGIVVINKHDIVETQGVSSIVETQGVSSIVETQGVSSIVETQDFASLREKMTKNKFGPQSQNLASIIRGYKIGVTKFARLNEIPFKWQERYYDHVIRNNGEHERIRLYILANVNNWTEDKFYQDL